jgi:hypothetical protein
MTKPKEREFTPNPDFSGKNCPLNTYHLGVHFK